MKLEKMEEIAREIVSELDQYGRSIDSYEYGLPVYNNADIEAMVLSVIKLIDKLKEE